MRLRDQHEWADSVTEWGWAHNFDAREGIHHKETIDMNTASQPAVVVDTDQLVDGVIAQFSRNIEAGEFERDVEPALDALKKDLRAAIAAIEATPAPVKAEPIKPLGADELQEFCSGHSFEQDDYTVDVIRTVENRMQGFAEFVPADPAQRAAVKFYTDNPSAALFDLGLRRAAAQAEPRSDFNSSVVHDDPEEPSTEAFDISRDHWLASVARVFLAVGDDEAFARSQALYLWREQDPENFGDPYETALEDIEGRPEQAEGAGAVAWQFRSQHSNGWQPCDRGTHDWCKTQDSFESRELHPPTGASAARPDPWRPFGLTVESALNRGDDPALLFDENSPIRGELRRLLADQPTVAAQPEPFDDFAAQRLRAICTQLGLAGAVPADNSALMGALFTVLGMVRRAVDERFAADALDAARYRWLRKEQQVTLITSYFGNGCVNKRIEQVEEIIDAAILAARTSEGDKP